MALDVQPGGKINIMVAKTPTNEGAAKTLSRIFAKDVNSRNARRRRKHLRDSVIVDHRRGGRPWYYRPHAPRLFQPVKGASCTILVTTDVVGDLRSVARFIEVRATK
jgi:hypothetical protein